MKESRAPLFAVNQLTKSYQGGALIACRGISFSGYAGEVIALMGENGAGKSTFARLLTQQERPDSGSVTCLARTALIPQHPPAAPGFTVADYARTGPGKIDIDALETVRRHYGIIPDFPWNKPADTLPLPALHYLELLRALLLDARLLVLDEPTAAMTKEESLHFLQLLKTLAKENRTIIFITHKLHQAAETADRFLVFRHGEKVWEKENGEKDPLDEEALSRAIFGEFPQPPLPGNKQKERRALCAFDVAGTNLTLHSGEITGIGGLRERGLEDLEEYLTGWSSDSERTPAEMRRDGIVTIPSRRLEKAGDEEMSVADNLSIEAVLSSREKKRFLERFGVNAHLNEPLGRLSGGNRHKVILARELSQPGKLFILAEPGRGLDIPSRTRILHELAAMSGEGKSILLLSSDPEDLLICHSLYLLKEGRLHRTDPATMTAGTWSEALL